MTATRLGTWARRNRWGLALLPIAAVAVLAASSDRLDAYYLMANPIRASVAEPGQAITFQTQAVDADGSHDLAAALQAVRLELIARNIPIGLFYTLHAPGDVRARA